MKHTYYIAEYFESLSATPNMPRRHGLGLCKTRETMLRRLRKAKADATGRVTGVRIFATTDEAEYSRQVFAEWNFKSQSFTYAGQPLKQLAADE